MPFVGHLNFATNFGGGTDKLKSTMAWVVKGTVAIYLNKESDNVAAELTMACG